MIRMLYWEFVDDLNYIIYFVLVVGLLIWRRFMATGGTVARMEEEPNTRRNLSSALYSIDSDVQARRDEQYVKDNSVEESGNETRTNII